MNPTPLRDMPGNGESLGSVIDPERARITRRCNAPKLSGTPYRADLARMINSASDMRRRGLKGLAMNYIDLARRSQHEAEFWQPIP